MSWNGYPHYIKTKTIKILQTREKHQQKNNVKDTENLPAIFCRIPCAGAQGDRLVKNLTKKLKLYHLSTFYLNKKHLQNN